MIKRTKLIRKLKSDDDNDIISALTNPGLPLRAMKIMFNNGFSNYNLEIVHAALLSGRLPNSYLLDRYEKSEPPVQLMIAAQIESQQVIISSINHYMATFEQKQMIVGNPHLKESTVIAFLEGAVRSARETSSVSINKIESITCLLAFPKLSQKLAGKYFKELILKPVEHIIMTRSVLTGLTFNSKLEVIDKVRLVRSIEMWNDYERALNEDRITQDGNIALVHNIVIQLFEEHEMSDIKDLPSIYVVPLLNALLEEVGV